MLFSMRRLETAIWHLPIRAIKMRQVVSACALLFTIFYLKVAWRRSYVFSTSSRQDTYGICAVHRHSTPNPSSGFPSLKQVTNNQPPTPAPKHPSILNVQKTGSLLKLKATPQASVAAQAPSPPQGPFTSGHIFAPALEEHRQQQSQQLLAQAQQLLQSQNYGAAFDTVEKALKVLPNDISALI